MFDSIILIFYYKKDHNPFFFLPVLYSVCVCVCTRYSLPFSVCILGHFNGTTLGLPICHLQDPHYPPIGWLSCNSLADFMDHMSLQ